MAAKKPAAKKVTKKVVEAPVEPVVVEKKRRFLRVSKKAVLLTIIGLIVILTPSVYFYNKYQDSQQKLKNPELSAKEANRALIGKVSKHAVLPTNEEPTIATVSDAAKLSNQNFFNGAKNGDKVLVYTKSKKAVLYRPSLDKVVNISPVTQ